MHQGTKAQYGAQYGAIRIGQQIFALFKSSFEPLKIWIFLLKSVSFCRKNSHNFFDTNYQYITLLNISYYDKVSKYGIAKIGDFGRFGRLEFLCNKMFSDWHQHFKVLSEFKIC